MPKSANDIQYQPPLPPIMFAEIDFCFDCEFDTEFLNGVLQLEATETMQRNNTRINPITGCPNPGYWTYRTQEFVSFDCTQFFSLISDLLANHSFGFSKVIDHYTDCEIYLRIYFLIQQEGQFPAIRITPQILHMFSTQNMTVDIIVDNDYVSDKDC